VSELLRSSPSGGAFPGSHATAHFEPRYRLLIRRCIEQHRRFGIVLIERQRGRRGRQPYDVGRRRRSCESRCRMVAPTSSRGERRFASKAHPDAEPTSSDRCATSTRAMASGSHRPAWPRGAWRVLLPGRRDRGRAESGRSRRSPMRRERSRIPDRRKLAVDAPQQQALLDSRRRRRSEKRGSSSERRLLRISSCDFANAESDQSSTNRGRPRSGRLRRDGA